LKGKGETKTDWRKSSQRAIKDMGMDGTIPALTIGQDKGKTLAKEQRGSYGSFGKRKKKEEGGSFKSENSGGIKCNWEGGPPIG